MKETNKESNKNLLIYIFENKEYSEYEIMSALCEAGVFEMTPLSDDYYEVII